MSITYRPAASADYEPVRRLLAECGWEARVRDPDRFRRIMEGASRTVVALEGERVVGFVRALCDGVSNGYISMLAVAADHRRQGIGTELVRRLLEEDPEGQVTWVLRAGRGSAEFWKKLGFTASEIAMERTRRVEEPAESRPGRAETRTRRKVEAQSRASLGKSAAESRGGCGMKLVPVESSMLQAVGYDRETRELEAVFRSGQVWRYCDVPRRVYTELLAAPSKGQYMRENVIHVYADYLVSRPRRRRW